MSLLDDVDDREEVGSLAIDADSLLYFSAYQFREDWDIELAYMNFIERIGTIRTKAYDKVAKIEDVVICFTTKTNFRYDIYPEYKSNRKDASDDAKILNGYVKALKSLAWERLSKITDASNVFEADDLVIQYADKGYLISAFDKDVVNASPTDCYNFKTGKWIKGKSTEEIDKWYLIQSIMGDSSDGIKGVKGIGKVGAEKFVNQLLANKKTFDDYVSLFETPADCLLMNQLVRMNQYEDGIRNTNSLKLIDIEGIADSIVTF